MTDLGEIVGRGRTSDVYAYGTDSVIKVAHNDVPVEWPAFEAQLTSAVWAMGVPAPQVRDIVEINGRASVVFARVAGPSMWQQMVAAPASAQDLARELAAIQKSLLQIGIPPGVPDLVDRLVRKIQLARGLNATQRAEAESLAAALPRGAALLHGDLHPGNVLMGADGPVVIDWFDATVGHPIADVVRSSLLIRPRDGDAPSHLVGATNDLLGLVHNSYIAEFRPELEVAASDLARWQGVVAAGRLAEDAELNVGALMALWNARADEASTRALLVP